MTSLRLIDKLQIATTVAFVVLGVLILLRAVALEAPALAYVVGAVFVVLGLYRAYLILQIIPQERDR